MHWFVRSILKAFYNKIRLSLMFQIAFTPEQISLHAIESLQIDSINHL